MGNITVIILTRNEEKNIEKCVRSAWQIATRVVVVDSGSEDKTLEVAKANGAETYYHEWQTYAKQFNWALDKCDIETEWVFRLDADESISTELAEEIKLKLSSPNKVDGYSMRLSMAFMGKRLKHGGTHKSYFLKLFRYGKGRVEDILMDEHVIVDGEVERLSGDIIHNDYKDLDTWLKKHIWYSEREKNMYLTQSGLTGGNKAQKKKRGFYYRLPSFFRARLYFWYRYYLQLGFLDGKAGKIYCFLQAYWYRFLVDVKIYENEKLNVNKKEKANK